MKLNLQWCCVLFLLGLSHANAQSSWVLFPGPLFRSLWEFQAVSESECVVLTKPLSSDTTQVLRLDARSGIATVLLQFRKSDRALMHWLSRDTGAVIRQEATPGTVHAYWTFDAGRSWDSLSFLPSNIVLSCQFTSWERIYLSLGRGAIGTIRTDAWTWNEFDSWNRASPSSFMPLSRPRKPGQVMPE